MNAIPKSTTCMTSVGLVPPLRILKKSIAPTGNFISFHLRLRDKFHINTSTAKMSFSNTAGTGDQPADPYKAKNIEEPSLKEKFTDLISFVEKSKFCMMTTRIAPKGILVSRCMALAGKVCSIFLLASGRYAFILKSPLTAIGIT